MDMEPLDEAPQGTRAIAAGRHGPVGLRASQLVKRSSRFCKHDMITASVKPVLLLGCFGLVSGGRAEKPRTSRELGDDGFHGLRIDCPHCGTIAELVRLFRPEMPVGAARGT